MVINIAAEMFDWRQDKEMASQQVSRDYKGVINVCSLCQMVYSVVQT